MAGDYKSNGEFVSTHTSPTGGLTLDFNQTPYGICQYSANTYVLDGLRLRLGNFRYATDGSLFVGFHSYEAYKQKIWTFDPQASKYGIYLQIGYNGQLRVTVPGTDQMTVLMENPLLKDTNLQGKEFILGFDEQPDGTYQVSFTVDGTTLTAVLDKDYMEALEKINLNAVWFIVHSGNGYAPTSNLENKRLIRNAFSIDITGIQFSEFSKSDSAAIKRITDIITNLPDKASYAYENDINSAWEIYFGLRTDLRMAIGNISKLFKLRNQLYELHVSDGSIYTGKGKVNYVQLPDETVTVDEVEHNYISAPSSGNRTPDIEQVIKTRTINNRPSVLTVVLLSVGGAVILAFSILCAVLIGKNKKGGKEASK